MNITASRMKDKTSLKRLNVRVKELEAKVKELNTEVRKERRLRVEAQSALHDVEESFAEKLLAKDRQFESKLSAQQDAHHASKHAQLERYRREVLIAQGQDVESISPANKRQNVENSAVRAATDATHADFQANQTLIRNQLGLDDSSDGTGAGNSGASSSARHAVKRPDRERRKTLFGFSPGTPTAVIDKDPAELEEFYCRAIEQLHKQLVQSNARAAALEDKIKHVLRFNKGVNSVRLANKDENLHRAQARGQFMMETNDAYRTVLKFCLASAFVKTHTMKKKLLILHGSVYRLIRNVRRRLEQLHDGMSYRSDQDIVQMQNEMDAWLEEAKAIRSTPFKRMPTRRILSNLMDVEHVLHFSLDDFELEKEHWKFTAETFFQRNSELKKQQMDMAAELAEANEQLSHYNQAIQAAEQETEEQRAIAQKMAFQVQMQKEQLNNSRRKRRDSSGSIANSRRALKFSHVAPRLYDWRGAPPNEAPPVQDEDGWILPRPATAPSQAPRGDRSSANADNSPDQDRKSDDNGSGDPHGTESLPPTDGQSEAGAASAERPTTVRRLRLYARRRPAQRPQSSRAVRAPRPPSERYLAGSPLRGARVVKPYLDLVSPPRRKNTRKSKAKSGQRRARSRAELEMSRHAREVIEESDRKQTGRSNPPDRPSTAAL